ncbi:SCAN domain-containing protein 3-like [Octopus bimaculoides]|uniref:SCAN domain-containing protein 3-like n=1 Tax=Octopus bimaculoides TaxID=37653 RepID=UPI00071C8E98|nr:SCAN domain-containing protein 3-like [Octopus bimaculoides]|eukprot:XP_014785211.1 PREDICTED: SCAN domain-containing protein 3-like [Octopus bimaculoides]
MPPVKKICRQYSSDYSSFEFIPSPQNCLLPMCLLCHQTLTNKAMNPSRLKYHFDAKHSDKKDKPLSHFLQLNSSFKKQTQTFNTLLQKTSKQENDELFASYNIALPVAKSEKSHTTGKTLLCLVIKEVLSTVMHEKPDNIMKIPISNNTISRHINEMVNDVKQQLINILQRSEFSIQVDESAVVDNQYQLIDEDLTTYRNYLQSLHNNMVERFQDVIALNIPNSYSNPSKVDAVDARTMFRMNG